MPENLSTLEELSDILDAIFRQRVLLAAAEAFIDYWEMTYSLMQVPKQGWPPAIRHCLSSVGLLSKEEQEQEPTLEPAFVEAVPLPRTPLKASFTTPPAVLKCNAFTTIIQSPHVPPKMFGPFPIIPSSPVSPLVKYSSDLSTRRTPLQSVLLCESPSKRRRLVVKDGSDEKENVMVPVVDRIAAITPSAAKKRRHGEVEDEVEEHKSGSSVKKLKSSMRPRIRSASKKARQHASPVCSVASSNESEDERRWVEATLTQKIPFPMTETQDDACDESSTPVLPQRKRHVRNVAYVLMPPSKMKEHEHTTSLDGSCVKNLSSSGRTADLTARLPVRKLMRRSVSVPESMLLSKTEKKRKRGESDAGDSDDDSLDLYDLIGSDPLPALHLSLPPAPVRRFRKAYSLPSSDSDVSTSMSSSSDDDPYVGQVTPHHLISPTLQRRVVNSLMTSTRTRKTPLGLFGERFGDSTMPGSDDSVTSTSSSELESPTKGVLTRQVMRALNAENGQLELERSIPRILKS